MSDSFWSSDLYGLGGWLILFQIWAFRSIANLLISLPFTSEPILPIIFLLLIIICMYFFYKRRALFRIVYIVIVVLDILLLLRVYPSTIVIIVGIVDALVILSLFLSRRVRNTFD